MSPVVLRLLALLTAYASCVVCVTSPALSVVVAQAPAPPSPQVLAEQAALRQVCGVCHDTALVAGPLRTPEVWEETIQAMVAMGATGSDRQLRLVASSLLRQYGRVNVNTGEAWQIAAALDIEAPLAEAVVRWRTERGAFTSPDDLAAVPDLEAQTVNDRRERLEF